MLAVRRHLRQARSGRVRKGALARANSEQMRTMAAGFLDAPHAQQRGNAGNRSGENGGGDAVRGEMGGGGGGNMQPKHMAAVLCFDEMQVPDPFAAVSLKALLEGLTAAGCVVVTTSNRTPRELPRHGLHEDMFDHLIDTMEQTCNVVEMSAGSDYRRRLLEDRQLALRAAAGMTAAAQQQQQQQQEGGAALTEVPLQQQQQCFLHPLGPHTSAQLDAAWAALVASGGATPGTSPAPAAPAARPASVPVLFGRSLDVPAAVGGAARFEFPQLCARPLGPADYAALAGAFHTVVISDIPVMSMQVRDQARRFITLIDELYNARVRLIATAAAQPDRLFAGELSEEPILDLEGLQFETAGARLRRDTSASGGVAPVATGAGAAADVTARLGGAEEKFAFARAVSRLHEMQSPVYLALSAVARRRG